MPHSSLQQPSLSDFIFASCKEAALYTTALFHVRERHILTRRNRLRLRYVTSATAGLVLVLGLYVSGHIHPDQTGLASAEIAALSSPSGLFNAEPVFSQNLLDAHRDPSGHIRRDQSVIETAALREESVPESAASEERLLEIGNGDTLAGVLINAGLTSAEAQNVINAVGRHYNPRSLRAGQTLHLTLEPSDTSSGYSFAALSFSPDPLKTIDVKRDEDGDIRANVDEKAINRTREARQVNIDGSVYGSADRADLPDRVTANTIKLFSYAVDFQRDIRSGDRLDVLYDTYKTDDGYLAKTGDIVYAKLTVGGKEYALYRYEGSDGSVDYYTADGKSIRKSSGLMRTPIAFGRLSSGFGVRTHPVLGYTKMHKGVDFAAPTGTPIYASGDGVIERASRFSSFGNYIRVRHSSKISTAYAHLSRYAKGIRSGVKVKQGQIIGYVGTTGRSTGPHLHYEVMVNGVQVNPRTVAYSSDNALGGKELKRFKQSIRALGEQYTEALAPRAKLASAE
ncbi:MAG: peptidoglycan DD-metalloendopeptidase family protein [Pseudobdellovibrionaceae bacterium]